MTTDNLTPERRAALLDAAIDGLAWALIEDETDTADRGVSAEHYQDARARAQALLPSLASDAGDVATALAESTCTCPTGDGSLRWPCRTHPPEPAATMNTARADHRSPDCREGKHHACIGEAWDDDADGMTECDCTCHWATISPEGSAA